MKKLLAAAALFVLCADASASENYAKVSYHPTRGTGAHVVTVEVKAASKDSAALSVVYEKLEALKLTGRIDYVFPDAPYITLEATYNDKTLSSSVTPGVKNPSKPDEYKQFCKRWGEAYAAVWEKIDHNLNPDVLLPPLELPN